MSLFEFRHLVFDEYRSAITRNHTENTPIDMDIAQAFFKKYEDGKSLRVTGVNAFRAENAKYRRKSMTEVTEMIFVACGDWGHKLGRTKKGPKKGELYGRSLELTTVLDSILESVPNIERKLTFGLLLGDNWYPAGLRSEHDGRRYEFDLKFLSKPRLRIPYYVTLGNHDSYGSGEAQVEFTLQHPLWNCPAFQFVSPLIRRGDITVQIFGLNTRLHFDQNFPLIPPQASWLDSALANSTAMWKIVTTHEPIWSFVQFEHEKALMQHIHPILMKHKVPLYVNGHAHHLSLFQCPGGYYQLTSGMMNMVPQRYLATRRPKGGYSFESGFQHVSLTTTVATVVATSMNGKTLWRTEIPLDSEKRLAEFESTDPWLWKYKTVCEAHLPVKLPNCQ